MPRVLPVWPVASALWISLRPSGVHDDTAALARVGWAVRRLTGSPGREVDLPAFLDRSDPEIMVDEAEPFADRAGSRLDMMAQAADLPPDLRRLPRLPPLELCGPRAAW